MPTATETDVTALIEGAFDEMECAAPTRVVPHGGGKAAYAVMHGCRSGFFCAEHLKEHIENYRFVLQMDIIENGYIACVRCHQPFLSVDAFLKVYPL